MDDVMCAVDDIVRKEVVVLVVLFKQKTAYEVRISVWSSDVCSADLLDINVSLMGKAKSLRGGALILTPLLGADGQIYAMAQGNLAVGGLGAQGAAGSKIVINIPSSGRIPAGATGERAVNTGFATAPRTTLPPASADFTTQLRHAACGETGCKTGWR